MNEERRHLSASQLEMFARCPESWRRRYVEREIIPPKLAMLKGSAVHSAAEHNMRQKMESREDIDAEQIADFAVNAFDEKLKHDGYMLGKDESANDIAPMRDVVAGLALSHATQQAPEYQPIAVEHKFTIDLPALSHDVVGVIDLVDEAGTVVDFKTTSRVTSQLDADMSTQLSMYAASRMAVDEKAQSVNVRLDILVEASARRAVRRAVVESTRDKSDLPILGRKIAVVSKSIDAGLFPPAPVGSWYCSEGWCGYWSTCPYVNSERIAASKQVEQAMKVLQGE